MDGYRRTLCLSAIASSQANGLGWVSAKQIPVHKINKALAFLQSEIDDWLKNKSHKTQDDLMEEAKRFVESKKIIR